VTESHRRRATGSRWVDYWQCRTAGNYPMQLCSAAFVSIRYVAGSSRDIQLDLWVSSDYLIKWRQTWT